MGEPRYKKFNEDCRNLGPDHIVARYREGGQEGISMDVLLEVGDIKTLLKSLLEKPLMNRGSNLG